MSLLLADEVNQLQTMSSVVLIMVVLLIVVTFCLLFFVYYKYYSKCIDNHLEDENIRKAMISADKKYFTNIQTIINNKNMSEKDKQEQVLPFSEHLKQKRVKQNRIKNILAVFRGVLYVFFAVVFAFALVVKFKGNLFYIKENAGLVVLTNSMQTASEENVYLEANNLTNQFSASTFIVLKRIQNENDINLYDVIAFKDAENKTIVHRVVAITISASGQKVFTCRGDANNASADFEKNISLDRILGKWTGQKSFVVGVLITYLSSSFGIITICFAIATITLYEFFEQKISKKNNKRKEDISRNIDIEIKDAIKNNTEVSFVSVDETNKEAAEADNAAPKSDFEKLELDLSKIEPQEKKPSKVTKKEVLQSETSNATAPETPKARKTSTKKKTDTNQG